MLFRSPGVSRAAFQARHGQDPAAYPACDPLRRRGLLELDGDRLYLTRQGVLFADEVGAALL